MLDVVPNHMAVSEPESQNAAWWAVLRDGPQSPYAAWFDIDWESADNPGKVLVPVLGGPLGEVVDDLELLEDRIRYYDHEVPIDPGTRVDGDVLATLERQHYRLCHWRVAVEELDYRRFFDVTTLAGVRVEDPQVFDPTHRLVLQQVADGVLDGLRIDHPDGLADPEGYLARLAEATGGSWVVVEKILEPGEQLPETWQTAGTTGYDALNRVLGLFVDPAGEQPLTDLWASETGSRASYEQVVDVTKHLVLDQVLVAEVNRLTELGLRVCRTDPALRDTTRRALREALVEVLAAFSVYRAYLAPAGPADAQARAHVQEAVEAASARLPRRAAEIALVGRLALAEGPGGAAAEEFVTRFQQTCGPVMAKGVEDTAFYRYLRFAALNEVGGDPGRFGLPAREFHEACRAQQADWPLSQTTLSTHDTKRSEDVRARLVLLAQCPREWGEAVVRWAALAQAHRSPAGPDKATELLVWQSLLGAWPISADRAAAYVEKATREAKARTSWVDPVPEFDEAVQALRARCRRGPRDHRRAGRLHRAAAPGVGDHAAGPEAGAAHDARGGRHLPGHRAAGPVARRPGQPPAGRLRRPPRRPRRPGGGPAQAAADGDGPAAAPRAPAVVPRRRDVRAARGRLPGGRVQPLGRGGDRGPDPGARGRALRLGRRRRRPAGRHLARPARRRHLAGPGPPRRPARRRSRPARARLIPASPGPAMRRT